MAETKLVAVEVAPDHFIQVEARLPDDPEADVAFGGRPFPIGDLTESITAISAQVASAIESVRPDAASVEFGLDVGFETGGLTALLVKGTGSVTLKITLQWTGTRAGDG